MNEHIFRKKSIDKISSPEQLGDYVRVSNPGVWIFLLAIIILLAGVCVWGVFGRLDTTITTAGISENGKFVCYVKVESVSNINDNMYVSVGGSEYKIESISDTPETLTDKRVIAKGGFSENETVYAVTVSTGLDDGVYTARLITERVAPISFVLN